MDLKISKSFQEKLICPVNKDKLVNDNIHFFNKNVPDLRYPIIGGIPVIINENKSIFSINSFKKGNDTTFKLSKSRKSKIFKKLIPSIGKNIRAKKNYNKLINLLPKNAKILIIGGSIKGDGIECIYQNNTFEIIESDVSFGPYTKIIFDAHDIPFMENTFDCVIVQAVLEHVINPKRCVSEIHRVLKSRGVVYAETPFIQQVHMRQYDFSRFTYLGHQRLFRNFNELDSGPCCGPGMALAWSYRHFLKSFTENKLIIKLLLVFGNFTSFYLKYFDYYLIKKPGSYDSASGFFFIGEKSNTALDDKALLKQYKGLG